MLKDLIDSLSAVSLYVFSGADKAQGAGPPSLPVQSGIFISRLCGDLHSQLMEGF